MSSSTETTYYMELQPGDAVQDGDQWLDSFGQWQPYVCKDQISGVVFSGVKARRPIRTTHQTTYEEAPGGRTLQQAVDQPQQKRIAYEELQPGDLIQPGDEWQSADGRWCPLVLTPTSAQVRDGLRARRPYEISTILQIGDALANAQKAATQLQSERDDALTALKSAQRARDELQRQVDELREQQSPVTPADQLSFYELTEKRIASLEDDLSQVRSDRDKLQGLIDDLLDEPTARQVQDMLRTWATELDWSACCFDSAGRDKVSAMQRVLVVAIERIEGMINPEATSAND